MVSMDEVRICRITAASHTWSKSMQLFEMEDTTSGFQVGVATLACPCGATMVLTAPLQPLGMDLVDLTKASRDLLGDYRP